MSPDPRAAPEQAIPVAAFRLPVTVVEGDIDEQGHASNVAVVRWMNAAAWEHSKALGVGIDFYRALGGWFVVRRHEIDYLRPSYRGDELDCVTWPCGIGKAVAQRQHRIIRRADGQEIARGLNVWAFVDATTGRPVRIPPALREAFDPGRFIPP
jgi:acyl-CoA thioester hydrolase